tara:strand:- start:2562 stop:2711 length:150 start_codon:yes stop_codon:yes gene_type:complete
MILGCFFGVVVFAGGTPGVIGFLSFEYQLSPIGVKAALCPKVESAQPPG